MVHVFCQNNSCRNIIHLDDAFHWNFRGKVKCQKCRTEVEVEIQNGEVVYARTTE